MTSKKEADKIINEMISLGPKGYNSLILGESYYNLIKEDIVNGIYKGKKVYTHNTVDKEKIVLCEGSLYTKVKKSIKNFLNY